MTSLPLDALRRVARSVLDRTGAAPLFVTVSGAHLYGFPSPDSDFDLRGCHLMPLEQRLSLRPPPETIECSAACEGLPIDLVSHDAAKFFSMMLKKNGYVLEQLFSPLVVIEGSDLEELRAIARRCISRHLHHHYRGFADNQRTMLEGERPRKIKTLLYWYRVLLTGIHVLATGEIEAHLPTLLEHSPRDGAVLGLIAAKVREKATLADEEAQGHIARCEQLRKELDLAFERSTLPEAPAGAEDLDRFLTSLRLRGRSSASCNFPSPPLQ